MKSSHRPVLSSDRAIRWIVGLLIFLAVLATPMLIVLRYPVDHYKFLDGRSPVKAGATVGMSTTMKGDSFYYRVYTWQSDFVSLRESMLKELAAGGFKVMASHTNYMAWRHPDGREVSLGLGYCQSLLDVGRGITSRSDWVGVACENVANDDWVLQVRLAIDRGP